MANSSSENTPIAINATQQITARLTPTNFPSWHAQFESLLLGYNLYGYVDGTHTCPPQPTTTDAAATTAYQLWFRQDKLILSAILTSISPAVIPLIATSKTSHQAWTKLTKLYASRSRTRVMQLKEDLTLTQRGTRTITEYVHSVKTIADELALIDAPLSQDDITLYVLHGLGSEYRDIVAPIRARESSLSFEELHDLLIGHEAYLKRLDSTAQSLVLTANTTQRRDSRASKPQNLQSSKNDSKFKTRQFKQYKYPPKCQFCDQQGHIAKYCPKLQQPEPHVNCTTAALSPDKRWLLDSAASHNITSQVSNLQLHSEYDGTDEVIIGDGSGLPITHSGSLTLSFPKRNFKVQDTLCVPDINKNLISVHHFTKQNNVLLEFHPNFFLVKDRRTGEIILQGPCEHGIYPLPSSSAATPVALIHERTSATGFLFALLPLLVCDSAGTVLSCDLAGAPKEAHWRAGVLAAEARNLILISEIDVSSIRFVRLVKQRWICGLKRRLGVSVATMDGRMGFSGVSIGEISFLENVVFDEHTQEVDYSDKSVTGQTSTQSDEDYNLDLILVGLRWPCSPP
ncbi:hypothetical protein HHK36_029986 [Tetracentron sinense]|uniref:CCHC-type domain-containing protein n=1 Tax=Tetracentron sinense TaxID=13715 RepID=A0A835CZU7_TETSI|nr:hypothetical protein HHK36_029986 [Tetracentron sinense]